MRTHFAHRPRQSCRKRPGRAAVRPLQLEQLTLFELEFDFQVEIEPARVERRQPDRRRRRRKAWLPRLIRWVKIRAARRD